MDVVFRVLGFFWVLRVMCADRAAGREVEEWRGGGVGPLVCATAPNIAVCCGGCDNLGNCFVFFLL